ncbi:MAG: DinB family protein [Acidobacteria bacterium]|nr:DinB family protein [Acidobacteriota bacterium]
MRGRPQTDEAAPYYFTYINQVTGDDVVSILEEQLKEAIPFFFGISEEKSLHRYAPEKWSIRQTLSHLTDVERLSVHRAQWFARGFDAPLPSFDQLVAVAAAEADKFPWAAHVEEFRHTRLSTVLFFRNLPAEAWTRRGIASDNPFTVGALAFVIAGHLTHHIKVLGERYSVT